MGPGLERATNFINNKQSERNGGAYPMKLLISKSDSCLITIPTINNGID